MITCYFTHSFGSETGVKCVPASRIRTVLFQPSIFRSITGDQDAALSTQVTQPTPPDVDRTHMLQSPTPGIRTPIICLPTPISIAASTENMPLTTPNSAQEFRQRSYSMVQTPASMMYPIGNMPSPSPASQLNRHRSSSFDQPQISPRPQSALDTRRTITHTRTFTDLGKLMELDGAISEPEEQEDAAHNNDMKHLEEQRRRERTKSALSFAQKMLNVRVVERNADKK